jgi:methylenetetrahydrofolate reductase (NADPH)
MTGSDTTAPTGNLRGAVASGRFVVTAELTPPRGTNVGRLLRGAEVLRDHVDAVNLTDNPSAIVRMSSWGAAAVVHAAGLEPICQLQCRDRNRIALQSDLLGMAALGIPNVLCLTGDHTRFGDHPEAKDVFDLDSIDLLWTASTLRDEGKLMSGAKLAGVPQLFIGGVENPAAPPRAFRAERLAKKIAAGADFIQTQYVFDLAVFRRFMDDARALGLPDKCAILAGTGPIRNRRALERLRHQIPGVFMPDEFARRFDGVPDDKIAEVGIDLCAEMVAEIAQIDGVAGVHLMAFSWEEAIPEIIERAGLRRLGRKQVQGSTS